LASSIKIWKTWSLPEWTTPTSKIIFPEWRTPKG
jgi:hypothetical protein